MDELVRLRALLLTPNDTAQALSYQARDSASAAGWRRAYRNWLIRVLDREDDRILVAVVPGRPGRPLWACAIAVVDDRAPTPACPSGRAGWVQSVVVDPQHRSRGLGSAVVRYALAWLREQQVDEVFLQTTAAATGMYHRLGFTPSGEDLLLIELRTGQEDN